LKFIYTINICYDYIKVLINTFSSLFIVCISGYAEERKQECSTARVIELIQNARKLAAQTHRQANNISDADAKLAAKNAKAISVPDENFADVTSNLEQRMSVLSDSVEKYVASN
jgi:hypothetical protein